MTLTNYYNAGIINCDKDEFSKFAICKIFVYSMNTLAQRPTVIRRSAKRKERKTKILTLKIYHQSSCKSFNYNLTSLKIFFIRQDIQIFFNY